MFEKLKNLYKIQALLEAAREVGQNYSVCGGSRLEQLLVEAQSDVNQEIRELETYISKTA